MKTATFPIEGMHCDGSPRPLRPCWTASRACRWRRCRSPTVRHSFSTTRPRLTRIALPPLSRSPAFGSPDRNRHDSNNPAGLISK